MSTPDSVLRAALVPAIPRVAVVPRGAVGRSSRASALASLPPALVAAAGLLIILTVALFSSRILAVNLSYHFFVDNTAMATALGSLSVLSIVAVAAALALGHAALRGSRESGVWVRQAAAIVVGAAYLHLILWATRVVAAAFAASSSGSSGLFLPNVFWWG